MYVARSEWKFRESSEYIGCSNNYDVLVDKVILWAEDVEKNYNIVFSNCKDRESKREMLKDQGIILSKNAYDDYADCDWVAYEIVNVDEF